MSTKHNWSPNKTSRFAVSIAVIAAATTVIATIFRQELPMIALDLLGVAVGYYTLVGVWSWAIGNRPAADYETAAGIIHHLRNSNRR